MPGARCSPISTTFATRPPAALSQVSEIAAVEGMDAVFFGPGDLSAHMGKLGHPADPEISEAIVRGARQVQAAGKFAGALAASADQARLFLSAGLDFVSVGSDCGLLFSGADRLAQEFLAQARRR